MQASWKRSNLPGLPDASHVLPPHPGPATLRACSTSPTNNIPFPPTRTACGEHAFHGAARRSPYVQHPRITPSRICPAPICFPHRSTGTHNACHITRCSLFPNARINPAPLREQRLLHPPRTPTPLPWIPGPFMVDTSPRPPVTNPPQLRRPFKPSPVPCHTKCPPDALKHQNSHSHRVNRERNHPTFPPPHQSTCYPALHSSAARLQSPPADQPTG